MMNHNNNRCKYESNENVDIDARYGEVSLTENGALSYSTVHDARIELFFKTVRGLTENRLFVMLDKSWNESPLDTLKIGFNMRDCRNGKGERSLFIQMMRWLCNKHPMTFLENMTIIPEYGRWLDLIEITESDENTKINEKIWYYVAHQLNHDYKLMQKGKPISLCAKWIPSEGSKWDKKTGSTYKIASYLNIDFRTLRKEYLTPLRTYLKIVEKYMCSKTWSEIDYSKVPSVAMKRLKKAFERNDNEHFNEWKAALASGAPNVKVNANVLFPHDLVREYLHTHTVLNEVTEAQWNVLVEKTAKLGDFNRSLCICDVSGSMSGTPMEVSVALGIMISSLCNEPYKNKLITFSESPKFHDIKGSNLYEKVSNVSRMAWNMNTNFQKVFDLILEMARLHELTNEEMPNRLYVFSDMQFDQAGGRNYLTNFETINVKYRKYGYNMPELVFWNLRGDTLDFPIGDSNTKNVALVSGFTTNILGALLNGKPLSPYTVLRDTIDNERYDAIRYTE